MNTQKLRDNYPKLIGYMEEAGYSATYIKKVRREIDHVLSRAESKGYVSYTDIYLEYANKSSSRGYLRDKLNCLGIIERFDNRSQYPDGRQRQQIVKRGLYHLLLPKFKAVVDCYRASESKRNKKATTIIGEASHGASFLYALQQKGINTLDAITEASVLSVFIGDDNTLRRSCSYKKDIAAVLKACIRENPDRPEFTRILAYLPELREYRKNIQYLKPDEAEQIKQALANGDSGLSFRDRAVGSLALYTGMRCCDIAGLTIDDIDWEKELICIRQQKTGAPLELPLSITVGNAIYDYLVSERPETGCEYVFISENRPYGRLMSGSIGNISNKIMKAANTRQSTGDRRGFHIFRHRVATELLGSGVPQPVISRTLGHTSPDSLETYLSADFKHLKECALSIERFPMPEGVFAHE
ncbi:Tyrosine recombinase XerC [Pelotomaculum schinkii]|uniref:Tyrosine recombinase XerC n=1 Tax=Pelotomaculum schinkii TaxID=78350 RepID=A0A4Y7R5Y2_9FIRM|nr:tyrosine-type recombinase/integrase [Pelotomaculum schinkii]TEB04267.1 Tyrosine recombinase XerC [Pelotomaculum schinkii]